MKMIITNKVRSIAAGLFPLCLFTFFPFNAPAQKLEAGKTTIDVGRTGYQMPVTATFEFKNKGHRHLKISEVRPDCHCTSIEFPKNQIGAGEKFQIKMTYDARQLGHFDHQAAVFSNATGKPFYIRMKGVVQADYQDFSGTYPVEMGELRLDKDALEFDDVNKGFEQVQELHIYNNGTRVYQPNLMHLPSYLTAVVVPDRLAPNRAGKITVTLHSENLHDYGLTQTAVYLAGNPGDKVSPDHEISVSAVLLPAVKEMTAEQRMRAPKLQMSKQTIDISFDGKKKKSDIIELTNQGQTELDISSLQMFTGGLKVSLGKSKLAPGQSTKLKVTAVRDELLKIRRRPRILMITNDPDKGKIVININAK
jgi:hypothetical protein